MTHEQRLRLIHRPFYRERFTTSYPWGGVQTGGYLFPDQSGGRRTPPVGNPDDLPFDGPSRMTYQRDGVYTLLDVQRIIDDGDSDE